MDMKAAMETAAESLKDIEQWEAVELATAFSEDDVEETEDDADMTQEEFDAGIDELFKDVPESDDSEYNPDEEEEPEWDEEPTAEQKREYRREMREESRRFNKEIDAWFDQMVADGTILETQISREIRHIDTLSIGRISREIWVIVLLPWLCR